jgi:hypothetical protein
LVTQFHPTTKIEKMAIRVYQQNISMENMYPITPQQLAYIQHIAMLDILLAYFLGD